jgi:BRCA1-associated protein
MLSIFVSFLSLLFSGMLGVPAKHKTPDLLQFMAPCHSELEMMRVIQYKDVPNQYMVLMRFRCQAAADEFYQAFNGLPYNTLEAEVCSLVYISKVETCKESEYYPLTNHTELPVCSICLERNIYILKVILNYLLNNNGVIIFRDG